MADLKKELRWSQLKVGAVLSLALLILLIAVFFAGAIENLFSSTVRLRVQFSDVKGLRKGAPVWINGTEVGSVKNIDLDPAHGTIVAISVQKKVLGFIKKDSHGSILTMGLLGDKYVELSPGSSEAEPIRPNDMIRGTAQTEIADVAGTGAAAIERMSDFINRVDRLLEKVESGQGTMAKLLNDPKLYDNLRDATGALAKTVSDLQNSRGTLRLLLEDTSLYNRMSAATSSLENFSKKLNEGQGTLQRLVSNPELYDSLNRSSKSLASILGSVEQGHGMAGALLRDEELGKQLKQTMAKLRGVAEEMDGLTSELKALAQDIKKNPKNYFKFSIF